MTKEEKITALEALPDGYGINKACDLIGGKDPWAFINAMPALHLRIKAAKYTPRGFRVPVRSYIEET